MIIRKFEKSNTRSREVDFKTSYGKQLDSEFWQSSNSSRLEKLEFIFAGTFTLIRIISRTKVLHHTIQIGALGSMETITSYIICLFLKYLNADPFLIELIKFGLIILLGLELTKIIVESFFEIIDELRDFRNRKKKEKFGCEKE